MKTFGVDETPRNPPPPSKISLIHFVNKMVKMEIKWLQSQQSTEIFGGRPQGGRPGFHNSAAEGGRKKPISAPKAPKFRKNKGFWAKKRAFLPNRQNLAKFGQFWRCGVSLGQISWKIGKFSKSLARWNPTGCWSGPKGNKKGGRCWLNPTKVQVPPYLW